VVQDYYLIFIQNGISGRISTAYPVLILRWRVSVVTNIETRAFAGAFLRWQDEVLLMHRSIHKKISPGLWAGIGGRIEPFEINSPLSACIREIEEETGIVLAQIQELSLRYFALCNTGSTLDSIYYFSGILNEKPLTKETPEGTLHWVKLKDGVKLEMPKHVGTFFLHWVNNLFDSNMYCLTDSSIQILNA